MSDNRRNNEIWPPILKDDEGHKSAKNRQIAKPSTSWMQDLLRMIPTKY